MKKLVLYNWLILAVSAFLVGVYIAIFEHFFYDKGYLFILLAGLSGYLYYRGRKTAT